MKALMLSTNSLLWELRGCGRRGRLCFVFLGRAVNGLAVDSPTAGAATPPRKVHVVSALDPEVIVVVEKRVPVVLVGRAYG